MVSNSEQKLSTLIEQTVGATVDYRCRICGHHGLVLTLPLGQQPLANSLLTQEHLSQPEPTYPLDLAVCLNCAGVQILDMVDPEKIFFDYLYFSSFSDTMLAHCQEIATRLIHNHQLNERSLVVEVASNDGYLLQYFKQAGIPVLGVEPARNVAKVAQEKGINTLVDFFNTATAQKMVAEGYQADVVLANNVLAHVPEINDFVEAFRLILKPHGVVVIETPYVYHLIEDCKFDTIYHEHLFYYSLTTLKHLFEQHQLTLVDVEDIKMHGGSLRVTFAHQGQSMPSERVEIMLRQEKAWAANLDYYLRFAARVERLHATVVDVLRGLKIQGKTIAAYGAAAKGSTFINTFNIGQNYIDFVIDRSPYKQNRYMPGHHIPIYGPDYLQSHPVDYLLVFTWNFAQEIMMQQSAFAEQGGRFIVCIPHLTIL
jgi:2-polyprenyl-3-methyl-5-hydroxy-6-metoxy-1,4-benzoquinol methylase